MGTSIVEDGLNFFDGQGLVFPEKVDGSVQSDPDEDGIAGPGFWFCLRQNLKQASFEANDIIVAYLSVIFQAKDVIKQDLADPDMGIIGVSWGTAELAVHEGQVG
jgi:hypothetical protein